MSDNGPQFTSNEIRVFMHNNGVKHIRTAPYHLATNGAAERFVQTALHTGLQRSTVLERCLVSFLLQYRNTPHATTGSPQGPFLWAVLFALVLTFYDHPQWPPRSNSSRSAKRRGMIVAHMPSLCRRDNMYGLVTTARGPAGSKQ